MLENLVDLSVMQDFKRDLLKIHYLLKLEQVVVSVLMDLVNFIN